MRRLLIGVLAVVLLCSCGSGNDHKGTALATSGSTKVGARAIRPGAEIGFLAVGLQNNSHKAITLRSMPVSGPGVGTVVRVVQEDITSDVPGSLYETDPPVNLVDNPPRCVVAVLHRVAGFRMGPGWKGWLWEVFRAIRPGRWSVPTHLVNYSESGTVYSEVLGQGDYGGVARNAPRIPVYWAQARCLRFAHLLSGWTRPRSATRKSPR